MSNVIDIKNLKVSFKRKNNSPVNIIRGIDLEIPEASIIGVVGETGSGKTVLGKSIVDLNKNSILQFDKYTLGQDELTLNKRTNLKKYRGRYISYIHNCSMNPTRTIGKQLLDIVNKYKKDSLIEARKNATQGNKSKNAKAQKLEYLRELLLSLQIINPESIFNLLPHEVSMDIKIRIAIAFSIIADSKLIVLDEVTSQLDSTTQSSIFQLIQKVNKEYRISFLLLTTNIWVVAMMCSYVYVIYAGKVVEKATSRELMTSPKHPYTWALISTIPNMTEKDSKIYAIPGSPPDMSVSLLGDPFAPRNKFAVEIDFVQEPPLFEVSRTHSAATWMLHPSYPSHDIPVEVLNIIEEYNKIKVTDSQINEDTYSTDDKIVESSYVEEMFRDEPKIKFDVSDTEEPVENNSSENIEPGTTTEENNSFFNTSTTDDEGDQNSDSSETDTITTEERKYILKRQAKMHEMINRKLKMKK